MYRITIESPFKQEKKYMYQMHRDIIVRTYSTVTMKARKWSLFYFPGWVGLKCAFCIQSVNLFTFFFLLNNNWDKIISMCDHNKSND